MSFKETIVGSVPEEWNVTTVEELVNCGVLYKPIDGNHGGVHPTSRDYVDSGIPFVMATDVKDGIVDLKNCKYISIEQAKTLKKGFSYEGDVLLTHKASIGRTAIVKSLTSEFIVLTPQVTYYRIKDMEKLHNGYLKYYFDSPGFQTILANWSGSGSTRAYLGILGQLKLPIVFPHITEQKKIAKILASLDEKIEVNNQINKTLEAMAQALFKQWFIDFEFPNENGEPYKSSGGEMVESELGLIPKGWEVGRFTDAVDVLSGGTPKTTISEYWNGEIPFFTPKDCRDIFCIVTEKYVTDDGVKNCNSQLYEDDTVFITARGTVGNIALAGRPMAMNQSCYALKGKNGLSQYMVFMQTKKIADDLKKNASGSVFDAITVNTFKSQSIVIPKSEIECRFSSTVKSLFEKLKSNQLENLELQAIRDTLLSKLMSGEIRVPIEEN